MKRILLALVVTSIYMAKAAKKMKVGRMVALGAGALALGATAYLLLGPNGKQNRKTAKDWASKMRNQVAEKVKNVKGLTQSMYTDTIAKVSKQYENLEEVGPMDLKKEVAALKKKWSELAKAAKKQVRKVSIQKKTK